MNTYNVTEFAKLLGVAVITLQRWDREGRLKALRTPSNRRLYTDEHLRQARGLSPKAQRLTIAYARVSSQAQKPDLDNQMRVLEDFCAANGWAVDQWVKEVGGGLNFKRPKFLKLIDLVTLGRAGACRGGASRPTGAIRVRPARTPVQGQRLRPGRDESGKHQPRAGTGAGTCLPSFTASRRGSLDCVTTVRHSGRR